MMGIYYFRNKITGEVYVGQSKDLEKRYKEHMYHGSTRLDADIRKYGMENFEYRVIHEFPEDELDANEEFFIYALGAMNGYNTLPGGQHCKGESNANAKLTAQDVYDIREAYNNHENKPEVYERYKNKVTKSYFSNLWEGAAWPNVHYDVYNPENLDYYSAGTVRANYSPHSRFSDEEVLELRKRYINETPREIYESVKKRCSLNALQQLLWGRTYTNVPVYNKETGSWEDPK